ncbi:MAG: hypothetical protein AAGN35_01540 [Bacteroidota bacterium]
MPRCGAAEDNMAYREFHINNRYGLYARFYFEVGGTTTLNPFLESHRTAMAAVADANSVERRHLEKFNLLDNLGIFATHTGNEKLLPLNAHLVLPRGEEEDAAYPVAAIIHGQAPSYVPRTAPTSQTLSYRGYRYLQRYLGDHGVASLSADVNFANYMNDGGHDEFQEQYRLQTTFLIMAMLRQVAGNPLSIGQLIFVKKSDGNIIPLHEALALEGRLPIGSPEARLRSLKSALDGKLNFGKLGFMGHSRGATAVQLVQPFFMPRNGTAPSNYTNPVTSTFFTLPRTPGPYNRNSMINHLSFETSLDTSNHLYHRLMDCMALLGSPSLTALKTVVALQPPDNLTLFNSTGTFFLAVASTHDNDVNEDSFNSYEDAGCPKAMVFSHGASHGRFNSVWRRLPDLRRSINRDVRGQSPIRMLSNRGHENLAKAAIGNAFLAGLNDEHHRYGFYTGELRAPSIRQDIERAWKFPYPFDSPPALNLLDNGNITAVNTTTGASVAIQTVAELDDEIVDGNFVFANQVGVKAFTRPATEGLTIRIPIAATDRLIAKTHFSFRYTKSYNPRNESERRNVNLRNYSLRLKSGTNPFGQTVAGSAISSLHYRAYPTKRWSIEVGDNGGYFDATHIVLQTAEIPLNQFLGTQPVSDLAQVNAVEIQLAPISGTIGTETFYFVDFILVTRNLPAAPAGFQIP